MTRRGAGVPFLIQAILASEPASTGTRGAIHTREAMQQLIECARSSSESVRVQTSNILRSLFKNTNLGDEALSFAGDGVAIALKGFKSSSWAVRTITFAWNYTDSEWKKVAESISVLITCETECLYSVLPFEILMTDSRG